MTQHYHANKPLAHTVEDFPVMPAEIAQVHLKPYNFCLFNPTNDVPPSSQAFNKSVMFDDAEATINANSVNGAASNGVPLLTNGCCHE